MQKIVQKIWIILIFPIWNFTINFFYFLYYLKDYNKINKKKKELMSISLKEVMSLFKWKKDSFKDWTPWIYVLIGKSFKDDCDGAANLAKWYLKNKGVKSNIISLHNFKEKKGHAVCVTKKRDLMISNNNIIKLDPNNWEKDILKQFKTNYEIFHIR